MANPSGHAAIFSCFPPAAAAAAGFQSRGSDTWERQRLSLEALRLRMDRLEWELQSRVRREDFDFQVAAIWEAMEPGSQGTSRRPRAPSCDSSSFLVPNVQLEEVMLSIDNPNTSSRMRKPRDTSYSQACEDGGEELTARQKLEVDISEKREMHRDEVQEDIRRRLRKFRELGKSDNDGDKATDLNNKERQSIDEDFLMKKYAKDEICCCKNAQEILVKAELLIEEDWLDKVEALPGNLFCLGAFGDIIPDGISIWSFGGLQAYSKYAGCFLIVLIQLIGPMLIFLSRMPGNIGSQDKDMYHWRCHPLLDWNSSNDEELCPSGVLPKDVKYLGDWDKMGSTKALGIVFILAFIMNGLFKVLDEQNTWRDLYNTFRFLDWKNDEFRAPGAVYLGLGAFVNCWVIMWSCLDMYVVAGASESPQDLLLDALGLLFLYRLDDVGGDLGFIDADDWPGVRIAWIYNELVHPWPDEEFDEDKLDWFGTVCFIIYKFTICVLLLELFLVPLIVTVTPFIDIAR